MKPNPQLEAKKQIGHSDPKLFFIAQPHCGKTRQHVTRLAGFCLFVSIL
jgi:hypothetical protein